MSSRRLVARAAKVLAGLLGAAVLLLVAGGVALQRLYPPEKLRLLVIDQASKALGREVRLQRVTLGLVSGLTLHELSVSEKPSFASGTFASVRSFSLRPRWSALLRRQLVIDSLSADGLSLDVTKRRDGSYNFSDLVSSASAPSPVAAPAAAALPLRLAVRSLRLRGSRLTYKEEGADRALALSPVDADVRGFALSGLFDATLSAAAAGRWDGRPVDGRASFAGALDLGGSDPKAFRARASSLRVFASGWSLTASGTVDDLSSPVVDVTVQASRGGRRFAQGSFKGRVSAPGTGAAGGSGELALAAQALSAEDASALGLPRGLALAAFKAQGEAAYSGGAARFKRFSMTGDFGRVELTGSVVGLAAGKPAADLEARLDLALPAQDAPWLGLPGALRLPAVKVSGTARVKGDSISSPGLQLEGAFGSLQAAGSARALSSAAPAFDVTVSGKARLPALSAADLPWAGLPETFRSPPLEAEGAVRLTQEEIEIPALRATIGRNELELSGARVSGWRAAAPAVSGVVKCRRFQLEDLVALTPGTRGLALSGSGFFAVAASGRLPRPILQGKLQFRDVGATVAGLPFSGFSGTASFSEKLIDVPNLSGRIGDGDLSMNVTVRNYARAPDVVLQASLTRFDLGRFLAAKAALARPAAPAAASSSAPPISARGSLEIGELLHPNADARDVRLDWDLAGLGGDLRALNGTAKFSSTSGRFSNLGSMATSKVMRVLLSPFIVIQWIGKFGGIRLFPDFNDVRYDRLQGDYAFKDGLMTLRDTRLDGDAAGVEATGDIDLAAEKLNLSVTAQVGRLPPVDVDVRGTFDEPKTKVHVVKALIAEPAKQIIQGLIPK